MLRRTVLRHDVARQVRLALGMRVYEKPLLQRLRESWSSDEPVEHRYEGQTDTSQKGRISPNDPRYHLKESSPFKLRREKRKVSSNPYEPEYYERLPDWMRADGMYAPLEIGKLIFYLLMPILALLALGSRNVSFVESLLTYTGDYHIKASKPTYDEQIRSIKKLDEEGLPSVYGDNIPVPGSAYDKRLKEEAVAAEVAAGKQVSSQDATAEYFTIMRDLREQQSKDRKVRAHLGEEAEQITDEARKEGLFVQSKSLQALM